MSYVYIRSEPGLYTVGHYSPDGSWHPDSDYATQSEAGKRVRFLNGGGSDAALVEALKRLIEVSPHSIDCVGGCVCEIGDAESAIESRDGDL